MEISGYKIVKSLGQGGMATVYLAVQESVNRYVALKVMSPELLSEPDNTKRFLREARMAARFRHPNIISIFDVSLANGQPYIAMEYVSGGSLDTERMKSMSLTEKLNVMVQCADAISFLHSQNFIHRDIKPGNILFREDNSIVLTDFGVAHDGDANTKITRTGFIIGTPHYMSPEQARGKELDVRADIYSLGVLLFRMLAGQVPFSADHPITVCTMHISTPVPDLPPDFARFDPVVKKAMAKEPDDRYRTANEFIDALIAVTGSDTARFLKRSVSGMALQEIEAEDMTTPSQLQRSYAGRLKARIEPTFSEPKTVLQPPPQIPAADHRGRAKPAARSGRTHKNTVKPARRLPGVLSLSLIVLGLTAVILLFVFGPRLWEQISDRSGQSASIASQIADAERLVREGSRSSLEQAAGRYAKILSEDPRNRQARMGRRTVKRLIVELDAATQAANADVQSTADQTLQNEQRRSEETIRNLLAMGREYARAPLDLDDGISASDPYKAVLKMDPSNQQAVQGLVELSGSLMAMAEISLAEGRLEDARRLLVEAGLTGKADVDRMSQLENRYSELNSSLADKSEEILTTVERGYSYLQIDQLSRPEGANAISEFNNVLALDSNNAEAQSGLKLVGQRYLELAESELEKGNRDTSEKYWNSAAELAPGLPGLADVRAGIDNLGPAPDVPAQAPARSESNQAPPGEFVTYRFENLRLKGNESSADLFRMAETELNGGNELRAYGLYRETLNHDRDHAGARRRLNRGAGVYLKYAGRDIGDGNLNSAYDNLVIALTLDADHPRADSTRRSYLAARQEKYAGASPSAQGSDDLLQNMKINLYLKNALSAHQQFTSDPADQVAASKAREQYEAVLSLNADQTDAKQGLARLCDEIINASMRANELAEKDRALWYYRVAREIDPHNPRLTFLEDQLE